MKGTVDVECVACLAADGAQIVEVLGRSEYEKEHLPGAVSIPLAELPARSQELDRDRPVVVYCYDTQCDLSPRAVALLVHLGFPDVYDFVTGKMAWLAAGLPSEGELADANRAGALAIEVPTCDIVADIATISSDLNKHGFCVVLDGDGVVLGCISRSDASMPGDALVADVMSAAPRTIRPSTPREQVAEILHTNGTERILVTTLAGELRGVVHRDRVRPA